MHCSGSVFEKYGDQALIKHLFPDMDHKALLDPFISVYKGQMKFLGQFYQFLRYILIVKVKYRNHWLKTLVNINVK